MTNNGPLIKDKKYLPENRDKENEKYHPEHTNKTRIHYNNEINTTTEFENNKFTNNYVNIPYSHTSIPRDRYALYGNNQNNYVQNAKTLTFATVKTNNPRSK